MKLEVGDKVKLNENIKEFKYGQASVSYDELGTIIKIDRQKDIYVNFPTLNGWTGLEKELVLVKKEKFFKKLPNDFTGTIEVENGYIVEKEILDEQEREYLSSIIRPFRHKVEYIVKFGYPPEEYISIWLLHDEVIDLPFFKKGTMYKGMEKDKKYTLEELSL